MSKIIKDRAEVPCFAITDYVLKIPDNPKRLVILLHGFTQSGEVIFEKLSHLFNEDDAILAPNGPFPFPEKKENHYKMGFAWYLYDTFKEEYFVDFKLPTLLLKNLVQQLNLSDIPKLIVGYSQGGYLSPFAASSLSKVKAVIGLACVFRQDMLKTLPEGPIHAIHGTDDLIVSYERAKEQFKELTKRGNPGIFQTINGEGHRLSEDFKKELSAILRKL